MITFDIYNQQGQPAATHRLAFSQKPIAALTAMILFTLLSMPAWATVYTVTNGNNAGTGSLRLAIEQANADGTADPMGPHIINIDPGVTVIDLDAQLTTISNHMRILGHPGGVVVQKDQFAVNDFRIFRIEPGYEVELKYLEIRGGTADAGNLGAGVFNEGILEMNYCTVIDNCIAISSGAAVFNAAGATLSMVNCSVILNTDACGPNGGSTEAAVENLGDMTLINTTIAGNMTPVGLLNDGALSMTNVLLADHPTDLSGSGTLTGNITNLVETNATAASFFIENTDPDLSSVEVCGQLSHLPIPAGSPADDTGTDNPFTPSDDQCGTDRSPLTDIGAIEAACPTYEPVVSAPINVCTDETGDIVVTGTDPAMSGTAPLMYSIDGGMNYQSSNTFAALVPGTYEVRIKDADDCESDIVTVSLGDVTPPALTCRDILKIHLEAGSATIDENDLFAVTTTTSFAQQAQSLASDAGRGLDVGDVNADGNEDVAVTNQGGSNAFQVFTNDGAGNFTQSYSDGAYEARDVAMADLDGDGDLDAVVAVDGDNQVYLGNGDGTFAAPTSLGDGATTWGVALGDVDGDCDIDIFFSNFSGASQVWLNDGAGNFTDSGQTLGSGGGYQVELADLDGDGDLDAFAANFSGANEVYFNDGTGVFTLNQAIGTGDTRGVALGDFDWDGDLDAYISNNGIDSVYFNDGTGNFDVFIAAGSQTFCPLLNETFDVDPPLSPTNVDGAWYPDRYRPAAFESDAGRLKISIDGVADGALNRPGGQQSSFYNTQGRKYNQPGNCVTLFRGDLYIPSEWATDHRRSDMWAGADNGMAISFYPIIGFGNVDGMSPTLRYYDGVDWVNIPGPINYDTWTTFEFYLDGTNVVYKVNGSIVGTVDSNGSLFFREVIMQAYNFNDPTLPAAQQSADSYDAFWDNLQTEGSSEPFDANTGFPDVADVDGDGDLDVIVPNFVDGEPNYVMINDGAGNFNNTGPQLGTTKTLAAGAGDFNNDGRPDAFLSGDLSFGHEVWLNTTTDVVVAPTDNCPQALTYTLSETMFDCSDVGTTTTVDLTVEDAFGNASNCSVMVKVIDMEAPEALCVSSFTVELDQSGNGSVDASDINNNSSDACSPVSLCLTGGQLAFDCSDIEFDMGGMQIPVEVPVVLTVTDESGNVSTCTSIVSVEDNIAPEALCQDLTVDLSDGEITPEEVNDGSNDNCTDPMDLELSLDQTLFECSDYASSPVTVTLTVTDESGNASTCTAEITVVDDIDPIASCKDAMEIAPIQLNIGGLATITPALIDDGSSDGCDANVTLSVSPSMFDCTDVGPNNVTLTVTDDANNSSTCTVVVTVEDNVPPLALCVPSLTVNIPFSGSTTITTGQIDNGSDDACGIFSLALSQTAFDCDDLTFGTPIVVTLTVTDPNGNVNSCNTPVTVQDVIPPNPVCLAVASSVIQLDAMGMASIVGMEQALLDDGSSDNCSIVSYTASPNTFDCDDIGQNPVTLTVTDQSGNASSCGPVTLTVEDNVDPTANCQDITIHLWEDGTYPVTSTTIDSIGGLSADACGVAMLSLDASGFDCEDVDETNTVTLTVEDNQGNISTCTANVTVLDLVAPEALCQNITVQLDYNGEASIQPSDIDDGSNDACGLQPLSIDISAFDCDDVGDNTVTLTVTDVNNNTSTCQATVTVEDNVAPDAFCVQSLTVELSSDAPNMGAGSITTADVDNESWDACGIASLSLDVSEFDCGDIDAGSITVTLTVTDENANVSTCTTQVTVVDLVNPTAVCQDITVELDANGEAFIAPEDLDNGSEDNCGIASLSLDITEFDCEDVGTANVTLTVTDVNNNTSTATCVVTIEDNLDPILPMDPCIPPVVINLNEASDDCSPDVTLIAPQVSDNCGIFSTVLSSPNAVNGMTETSPGVWTGEFPLNESVVTVTITDNNGNVSTCTTTITVNDLVAPVINNCPLNFNISTDEGQCGADVTYAVISATDNCGIASFGVSVDGPEPLAVVGTNGGFFPVGTTTVTFTATDFEQPEPNETTCVFTVTVMDNDDPELTCQGATLQLNANGEATLSPLQLLVVGSDNCDPTLDLSVSQSAFDCTDLGFNQIVLTATDDAGNSETCTVTVEVQDNIDPTAVCTQDLVLIELDANGQASISEGDIDAGSDDNCDFELTLSVYDFGCDDIGFVPVTLTIEDEAGNVDQCTVNVLVEDNIFPIAECQDVTINLNGDTGEATLTTGQVDNGSSDACGITLGLSQTLFTCADVGQQTVTLFVTDPSGNTSTCTAIITVQDVTPPSVQCQSITVQLDGNGMASVSPLDIDNGSTDKCGIASYAINDLDPGQSLELDCSDVPNSPIPVTLTVTDINGNSSSSTFQNCTITIQDVDGPVAVCEDITVYLDAQGQVTITPEDVDGGSGDACADVFLGLSIDVNQFDCDDIATNPNTVILTVTDVDGNTDECEALVTVLDNLPPVAKCKPATVFLTDNNPFSVSISPSLVNDVSTDNCGIQGFTVSPNTFDCSDLGDNVVTLSVRDESLNLATCTTTVTVVDDVDPMAACQDLTVALDANGQASITPQDANDNSTDNCSISGYLLLPGTPDGPSSSFSCDDLGPNLVILRVIDGSGNTDQCELTVTVVDQIAPLAICDQDIPPIVLVDNGNGPTGNLTIGAVDDGSTDNCTVANRMLSQNTFTCADLGFQLITLTVTDQSGNQSTCTTTVEVTGDCDLNIGCINQTVELDANGQGSITPEDVYDGDPVQDNVTLALNDNSFDCTDLANGCPALVQVVLTAVDNNNPDNIATCSAVITVVDNLAPDAVCAPFSVDLGPDGMATIVPANIDGGSTDNCGPVALSFPDAQSELTLTCDDFPSTTVTLVVTDGCGNTDECQATVTVNDTTDPEAICVEGPLTVQLNNAGTATVNVNTINGGSFDDFCGLANGLNGLSISGNGFVNVGTITFDCDNLGDNLVTLTATDLAGNSATCEVTVIVEDNISPVASCVPGYTIFVNNGTTTIVVDDIDASSTDNCTIVERSIEPTTFSCDDIGTTVIVTLFLEDQSGNTSDCTTAITVEGQCDFDLDCQDLTVAVDANGEAVVPALDIVTSDPTGLTFSPDPFVFTCADLGANPVILNATDANGGTTSCSAVITVIDDMAPMAICRNVVVVDLNANGVGVVDPATVDNGSTDNCDDDLAFSLSQSVFGCTDIGNNTETLTVTDDSGNSSTCTTLIRVRDRISPTALCQDVTVFLDANGNASVTAAQVDNGSFDNCGIASLALTPTTTFDCDDLGPNGVPVTLLVTDVNGRPAQCTATVFVVDDIDPAVACMDATVVLNQNGIGTLDLAQVVESSSDNCGVPTLSLSQSVFTCDDFPTATVVVTATDDAGNTAECFAVVTVEGNCIDDGCQNVTVFLDIFGDATVSPADVYTGDPNQATLSLSQTEFDCTHVGDNPVVLTFDEGNGTQTCDAIVTVIDDITPTCLAITSPLIVDIDVDATITAAEVDNGSFDNCGFNLTVSQTEFDCDDVENSPIIVILTVTDDSGNSSSCEATIIVEGACVDPVDCQDITVCLDGSSVTVLPQQIYTGSEPNPTLLFDPNQASLTFGCDDLGPNMVTLVIIGANGTTNCEATITVEDCTPPTAVCQSFNLLLPASGIATVDPASVGGGSTDNCDIASLTLSQTEFGCDDIGPNAVTLTVTDPSGNSSTCTASIRVRDRIDPTALCMDITVLIGPSGVETILPEDVDGGSSDACGIASLSISEDTFTCDDIGENPVVLTVVDNNGNDASCTAIVTVEGSGGNTVLECAEVLTVALDDTGNATIDVDDVFTGNIGGCGGGDLSLDITNFDCSAVAVSPITVTLTFTDALGNMSMCTTEVTVVDDLAPDAVCNDLTVQLGVDGTATITPSEIDGGSTDNCGVQSLEINPFSFDCDDLGENPVTLTVVDVNGNVSTCTATVTVEESGTPVASCQDLTIELDDDGVVVIDPADVYTGAGSCLGFTLELSQTEFTCSDVANSPIIVTLTLTDANNTITTCTSVITVVDNMPPDAVCMDATVFLNDDGLVTVVPADVDGGSTDNCGIQTLAVNPKNFDCDDLGETVIVTLRVIDVNGNQSLCQANVTILDGGAPEALCVPQLTVELDVAGNATIDPSQIDAGSNDNASCGGPVTLSVAPSNFDCNDIANNPNLVVLTVTDEAGNSSTCTTEITLVEGDAPQAACVDLTVELGPDGTASIDPEELYDGDLSGGCSNATASIDHPGTFDCTDIANSPIEIELTLTDGANVSTCVALVTVVDNLAPEALCAQPFSITLDAMGMASIDTEDVDNGSSDNCTDVSLSLDITEFTCADVDNSPVTVTLTVTDGAGNASTCTTEVTVEGNTSSMVLCENITVELDANGMATVEPIDVFGGITGCNAELDMLSFPVFSGALDCDNLGVRNITLEATFVGGGSDVCTATLTIVDNIAPVISGCPDNIGFCSAMEEEVFWTPPTATDNCSVTLTSNFLPGDQFTLGATTVVYTATDGSGNETTCSFDVVISAAPAVVIGTSSVPDFCQGLLQLEAVVTNDGFSVGPYTYEWTVEGNNLNMDQATITALEPGLYEVTVTNAAGCTGTASFTVSIDPWTVLSGYDILTFTTASLSANTVNGGGVGTIGLGGSITVNNGTNVNSFVIAPTINILGGSVIATQLPGIAPVALPPFKANPNAPGSNVVVLANTTETLSGDNYGVITVQTGATLIIDNPAFNAVEIVTEAGATVEFMQPTEISLTNRLIVGDDNQINPDNVSIVVYVEGKVRIGAGTEFFGSVYGMNDIALLAAAAFNPTEIYGLFIGSSVVSGSNVIWNQNGQCDLPINEMRPGLKLNAGLGVNPNIGVDKGELTLYPNPTSGKLWVEWKEAPADETVRVEVFNRIGKLIHVQELNAWPGAFQLEAGSFEPGMHILKVTTESGWMLHEAFIVHQP